MLPKEVVGGIQFDVGHQVDHGVNREAIGKILISGGIDGPMAKHLREKKSEIELGE